MLFRQVAACLLAVLLTAAAVVAGAEPVRRDHATVELVAESAVVVPGDRVHVGLRIRHDPEWHTYWINPGDSGLATRLDWQLPDGVSAGAIEWPAPRRFDIGGVVNFAYEGDLLLPVAITVSDTVEPGSRLELSAKASWLICKDICIPGDAELALALDVVEPGSRDQTRSVEMAAAFDATRAAMPQSPGNAVAAFVERGDAIEMAISGLPATLDPAAIEIFPVDTQILASAAGVAQRLEGGAIGIRTPKNDYFVGMPERLGLVLVHDTGAVRESWALTANPGDVPEIPAAAASGPAQSKTPDTAVPSPALGPGLLLALVLALGGGVILNLMPCVFPVLALKAMGLMHVAHDRRLARRHGLFYLAGVLASFLALGGLLIGLRAGGEALGWGFQLQVPWVVGGLALLMLAMGLSLSGLYEIGGRWMNLGSELAGGDGDRASFFTGVLAVLVASPCTAPFMGPALGFAATQPAAVALLVFAALGLGLALPIVLISLQPALARWLPRPGAWMDTFKQVMAFPLYLTAVWLLWVLGRQAGVDALAVVLLGATTMAFGLWLFGRSRSIGARLLTLVALALAAASLAWASTRPLPTAENSMVEGGAAEAWTPQRFEALRAEGRPVLVNMTAAWCITCLANERIALSSEQFRAELARHEVAYLKGDWTHRDSAITAYLARYGRNGVPLYVVYPRGTGDGEVLPQLLTPELVVQALARAAEPGSPLPPRP
jgi:thiol:disulfide interchange protein DsbD